MGHRALSDPTTDRFHSHQVPVLTVDWVSCHVQFLTRAGCRTLLCTTCRHRFRSAPPARSSANPEVRRAP
jgi:hypothetical protein